MHHSLEVVAILERDRSAAVETYCTGCRCKIASDNPVAVGPAAAEDEYTRRLEFAQQEGSCPCPSGRRTPWSAGTRTDFAGTGQPCRAPVRAYVSPWAGDRAKDRRPRNVRLQDTDAWALDQCHPPTPQLPWTEVRPLFSKWRLILRHPHLCHRSFHAQRHKLPRAPPMSSICWPLHLRRSTAYLKKMPNRVVRPAPGCAA